MRSMAGKNLAQRAAKSDEIESSAKDAVLLDSGDGSQESVSGQLKLGRDDFGMRFFFFSSELKACRTTAIVGSTTDCRRVQLLGGTRDDLWYFGRKNDLI